MADVGDVRARLATARSEILARRPEHSVDPTLDRIRGLVTLLGDPQRAYPVIHITGTNGKTSTSRMIESLLRERGLRCGVFTSPHLSAIQERIRVDGEQVSAQRFVDAYAEIRPYLDMVDAVQPVRLSFFEVLTSMAFAIFADAPIDVAVVEVGMGGTWDCTNVADGTVAVVTPISIDHARYLGNTVGQIATDKAGIIKPGATAVLAQQPLAAAEALVRRAATVGATVAREGLEFGVLSRDLAVGGQVVSVRGLHGEYPDLYLPLFGAHQAANLACAIAAAEAFAGGAGSDATPPGGRRTPLAVELVRAAVAETSSPGRLEVVRRAPVILVDAAHNPAGMAATAAAVEEAFSFADLTVILAVSADKDVPAILDQLEPVAARIVVSANSSGRSLPPAKLAELAGSVFGWDRVTVADRLDDAIERAVAFADEAGGDASLPATAGVLITGSVVTAGDALTLLRS